MVLLGERVRYEHAPPQKKQQPFGDFKDECPHISLNGRREDMVNTGGEGFLQLSHHRRK